MASRKIAQDNPRQRYMLWNVAYIMMIVACVITVTVITPIAFAHVHMYLLFIVIFVEAPLLWLIPMTLMVKRCRDEVGTNRERNHLVLAVCCTVFAVVIPGIVAIFATSLFIPKEVKINQQAVIVDPVVD